MLGREPGLESRANADSGTPFEDPATLLAVGPPLISGLATARRSGILYTSIREPLGWSLKSRTMLAPDLKLRPVESNVALKDKVYEALKSAITSMEIYTGEEPPRLDERRLGEELGVSRTPVREALARLEHEGLVETLPRRGVFVVRKSKAELIEIVHVWAALEGMAARLATERAEDGEIAELRNLFSVSGNGGAQANIDEYSDKNIRFHQAIIRLAKSSMLSELTDALFVHMRAIRAKTIGERDRASRSIIDHIHIIDAIEARDAGLAERLVREHSFGLAEHIRQYVHNLR
jgi:DNA-binding GntR family transcriptional regulator